MYVDPYNIIYYITHCVLSRTSLKTTLFISTVKYTVEVHTPNSHVNSEYRLTVRIKGEGGQKTADHVLKGATQEKKGYAVSLLCFGCVQGPGEAYKVTGEGGGGG